MNIVKPEKIAKIVKSSELHCGQYFTVDNIESQWHLRTAMGFDKEGWAITVGDKDSDSAVGETWGSIHETGAIVTLCDKDGNPEYEEAGEEVPQQLRLLPLKLHHPVQIV